MSKENNTTIKWYCRGCNAIAVIVEQVAEMQKRHNLLMTRLTNLEEVKNKVDKDQVKKLISDAISRAQTRKIVVDIAK